MDIRRVVDSPDTEPVRQPPKKQVPPAKGPAKPAKTVPCPSCGKVLDAANIPTHCPACSTSLWELRNKDDPKLKRYNKY